MPTRPASVLLVTPRWTRDGGVATHVQASAQALARAGVEVHVLAARIDADAAVAGIALHRAPRMFDAAAPARERLGAELPAGVEVAHVHQVDDPVLVDALRATTPVVMSMHGYAACTSGVYYFRPGQECTRGHGPGCVPNLLARGCAHTARVQLLPGRYRNATRARRALAHADLVVAYSAAVDRHLAANGMTRRRVIPLFATVAACAGSGHETRRRVVFAGRLVAAKGVDVLIRAAREVDATFVVCGDGRLLAKLRGLARRLGVAERVAFRGWLTPEQLALELAEASVVAVPSRWPEPFGLVGIEAFGSGRPVVASATGGIVEWLEDGVSGLAVPPGDAPALATALSRLLDDPALQARMGEAGRRAARERFTPERHVAALLDAYRAAIDSRRASG